MTDQSRRYRYRARRTFSCVASALFAAMTVPAFGDSTTGAAVEEGASFAIPFGTTPEAIDSQSSVSAHDIAAVLAQRFHVGLAEAEKIGHAVIEAARREALSPMLLLAVIAVESGFDSRAHSEAGAVGLMQVLPSQHKDRIRHAATLWDTDTNVSIGSSILHEYLTAADGDLNGALARYSGGARGYPARVTDRLHEIKVAFRAKPLAASEAAAKY